MPERKLGPQVDIYGVINDAREALLQKSHDVAHGVEHHQNVADNVDYIVNAEGIKQEINYDALKVAAWWHDYDRHSADYSVMTNSLEKHGANPGFIDEVIKPEETRQKLIRAFKMLENKVDTLTKKKHGNIPL